MGNECEDGDLTLEFDGLEVAVRDALKRILDLVDQLFISGTPLRDLAFISVEEIIRTIIFSITQI